MEKNLIKRLLQICQSAEARFTRSKGLNQFQQDYNIGTVMGASLHFSPHDKSQIRALLLNTESIDADTTDPTQWDGLSRTESLALGSNEKLTHSAVRQQRVAIKHLPQQALLLGGSRLVLPEGSNLDVNWQTIVQQSQHDTVLVVENWEAFERIHQAQLDFSLAGKNPLVVFRGSPVYQQDHTIALLEALQRPVFAFVDFDPAGLMLAQSLPCFQDTILPPMTVLESHLQACTNHERYQKQLPQTAQALDSSQHATIAKAWEMLKHYGVALPQERFL
ncbi:DUF7281 domain-containing protein [Candidatus Thiothrix anitrata]|uniref:DUF2399 domain-containing protein n=1 Tax=Candidatus Thiothrix anitrata TaxID=2823902 RepID=A0ABX7X5L5_9GAMM|nr:DUF2399 domain-containing protein [Candidatus Thiothrix anitrata]QTR50911.1 DUF2399 domain-containing protein [Candidatus Thiothrix anitrata]